MEELNIYNRKGEKLMIKSLNSLVKIRTIATAGKIARQNNVINSDNYVMPNYSYKALAMQVKAMADADSSCPLGAKLNFIA